MERREGKRKEGNEKKVVENVKRKKIWKELKGQ